VAKELNVNAKNVEKQIAKFGRMNMAALKATYKRVFGKETVSRNRELVRKRLAARLREMALDGSGASRPRDERLPASGTVLERTHDGTVHEVTVLEEGFRYDGAVYGSLSTVAKVITGGGIWNGFVFFGRALKEARS
jgi:hypothetical protein